VAGPAARGERSLPHPDGRAGNVVLHGGNYWLSVYGRSDGLGPTMQMYDVTYWGTTGGPGAIVQGKPAYKIEWPKGLDAQAPDISRPDLPTQRAIAHAAQAISACLRRPP